MSTMLITLHCMHKVNMCVLWDTDTDTKTCQIYTSSLYVKQAQRKWLRGLHTDMRHLYLTVLALSQTGHHTSVFTYCSTQPLHENSCLWFTCLPLDYSSNFNIFVLDETFLCLISMLRVPKQCCTVLLLLPSSHQSRTKAREHECHSSKPAEIHALFSLSLLWCELDCGTLIWGSSAWPGRTNDGCLPPAAELWIGGRWIFHFPLSWGLLAARAGHSHVTHMTVDNSFIIDGGI